MLSANKMLFYYHLCLNIIYLTRLFGEPLIINRTIIIILKNAIPTETDENLARIQVYAYITSCQNKMLYKFARVRDRGKLTHLSISYKLFIRFDKR